MLAFLVASAFAQKPVFEPASLHLSDRNIDSKFSISLDSEPEGPVSVYLNSPGMTFDKCQLTFDATNYNVTQEVSAAGVPIFENTADLETEIKARTFIGNENYEDSLLPVTRETIQAGSFSVHGDPHYTGLDGQSYDFQGTGFFKLLSHPDFEIEVFHDTYTEGTSIQTAAAVRYHHSIFILDIRVDKTSVGAQTTLKQLTPNVDGVIVTEATEASPEHVLEFPCGSKITLLAREASKANCIDINGEIVAGYGRTGGLVNTVESGGKFLKDDGTFVEKAKLEEFGESWRVDENDNLFNGKFTDKDSVTRPGSSVCPVLPVNLTPPSPPYSPPTLPGYSKPPVHYSPPVVIAPPPANFFDIAVQTCTEMYPASPCDLILNTSFFIDSCVADASIVGNFFFAEASKQVFLNKCGNLANNMIDNALPGDTDVGNSIVDGCGFKDKECPKSCSNHGKCTTYGCVCHPGFAGIDCAVDLAPIVQRNPDTNTYTANCPPSTYAAPPSVYAAPSTDDSAPSTDDSAPYGGSNPTDDSLSVAPKEDYATNDDTKPIYSSAVSSSVSSLLASIVLFYL